jgi:tRNA(adenine34) deaminase
MNIALKEAKKCLKYGDVPVGAVIIKNGKILATGYNKKEKNKQVTHHAEIIAITRACKKVKSYRLDDSVIYITKEPCLMCMGAILSARISKIIYGVSDLRFGTKDLATNNNFNHKCDIKGNVCEDECRQLLSGFFKNLREKHASSRKTKIKN